MCGGLTLHDDVHSFVLCSVCVQAHLCAGALQGLMQEQMRNADRAMTNIESHPEGFNALRRVYETIQVRHILSDRNARHFASMRQWQVLNTSCCTPAGANAAGSRQWCRCHKGRSSQPFPRPVSALGRRLHRGIRRTSHLRRTKRGPPAKPLGSTRLRCTRCQRRSCRCEACNSASCAVRSFMSRVLCLAVHLPVVWRFVVVQPQSAAGVFQCVRHCTTSCCAQVACRTSRK
jgi:hypothetical protein